MDGLGSISPSEMQSMHSLSKQRLPIQSKHVEQLIASVDAIQKEARDKALEEAARLCTDRAWLFEQYGPEYSALVHTHNAIRALKEA
ncbi:hypothetical protein [Roseibium sp.]|uniref:hypothetical protein n=1 Tax=Roseibium sp. TaxID=1936156 RepID=UPI003B521043